MVYNGMVYNRHTFTSLKNDQEHSIISTAVETDLALKKIYGTGLLYIIKKIVCILPWLRSARDKKVAAVFANSCFRLEVVRDNTLLKNKFISLSNEEVKSLEGLLNKVAKFSQKKIYSHLNAYHTALESTLLKKNSPARPHNMTQHLICKWSRKHSRVYMRDPIAKFINDPLFNPEKYFKKLRSLPPKERASYWDDLSNLNSGISTKDLKEKVIPDIKHDKDKKYLYALIQEREELAANESCWFDAIDQMEEEYKNCLQKQNEAFYTGKKLWQTLQNELPQYLYLLDNKKIRQEFKDWVIRDKQSPHVFFQSRACVQMMKEFAISDHIVTCKDKLYLDENKVPHILQEGKGNIPWNRIPWDEIFIANEYIREDVKILDSEIGSKKKRNLYYMPERGLTEHEVLNNNVDSFNTLRPFRHEVIVLKEGELPKSDITPVISYESNKPTVADTHVYVELRIPDGEVFIEDGVRKVKMKVYPFGVGHDTKIRNSKRTNSFYFLTNVLPNAMKVDPIELFMPDQNEFYRTRQFTKLDERVKLEKNELEQVIQVLQSFQRSSQNLEYKGPDKKTFHASLNNCTQFPTAIYKVLKKYPLPKAMPLHHCMNPGLGKTLVKFIHKSLPGFLRTIVVGTLGVISGGKGKTRPKDFHVNTTWLQRVTMELINQNNRFKKRNYSSATSEPPVA